MFQSPSAVGARRLAGKGVAGLTCAHGCCAKIWLVQVDHTSCLVVRSQRAGCTCPVLDSHIQFAH